MAKGRKRRSSGGRGHQRAKFAKAAKHCWAQLRAGKLPKRGQFSSCMRKGLKGR